MTVARREPPQPQPSHLLALQGLNLLLLAALVGGAGFAAKRFQSGKPLKRPSAKHKEAESGSSDAESGEEETEDSGDELAPNDG